MVVFKLLFILLPLLELSLAETSKEEDPRIVHGQVDHLKSKSKNLFLLDSIAVSLFTNNETAMLSSFYRLTLY